MTKWRVWSTNMEAEKRLTSRDIWRQSKINCNESQLLLQVCLLSLLARWAWNHRDIALLESTTQLTAVESWIDLMILRDCCFSSLLNLKIIIDRNFLRKITISLRILLRRILVLLKLVLEILFKATHNRAIILLRLLKLNMIQIRSRIRGCSQSQDFPIRLWIRHIQAIQQWTNWHKFCKAKIKKIRNLEKCLNNSERILHQLTNSKTS